MEREVFFCAVGLDDEETSGLLVFWVETHGETLDVLDFLFCLLVVLDQLE